MLPGGRTRCPVSTCMCPAPLACISQPLPPSSNVRSARFLMQNNSSVFAKRFHFPTQWALWARSLRVGQINAKIGHLLSGARWCAFFSAPLIIPRRHGTIGETELRGVMEVSLALFFCLLLMENRGGRVGTWHSIPSQLSLRSYTSSSAASS